MSTYQRKHHANLCHKKHKSSKISRSYLSFLCFFVAQNTCDVIELVGSQCRSPRIVGGLGRDYAELRERKKNATDVTFHRVNEKHCRKLIDDVRQFEKS